MIERSTWPTPQVQRRSRPKIPDAVNTQQQYQADVLPPKTDELPPPIPRPSWLKSHAGMIGAGMIIMVALYIFSVTTAIPFITDKIDHWNTGTARISHFDLNVGHGGISHFLTEYWRSDAVVIEMHPDKPNQTNVYTLPVLIEGDTGNRVITLKPTYVQRNPHPGYPDLFVYVEGVINPLVLYNTGGKFSPELPQEQA